jgi:hypothetical protein
VAGARSRRRTHGALPHSCAGTPGALEIPMRDIRLFVIAHLMLLAVAIVGSI